MRACVRAFCYYKIKPVHHFNVQILGLCHTCLGQIKLPPPPPPTTTSNNVTDRFVLKWNTQTTAANDCIVCVLVRFSQHHSCGENRKRKEFHGEHNPPGWCLWHVVRFPVRNEGLRSENWHLPRAGAEGGCARLCLFLCLWFCLLLLFSLLFHFFFFFPSPRFRSLCQRCRRQVTAEHARTLPS